MSVTVALITAGSALASKLVPIAIDEGKKMMHISRLQKQINELGDEISNIKLEIGNHCYARYEDSNDAGGKTLESRLLSISDTLNEIAELEENISQILLRYSEIEETEISEEKNDS